MNTALLKFLNSNSGRIVNNIIWLLLDKGIRMSLGLLIGVWVARYLGPEQFGKLNYGQAYIAIFSVLVNLGLDTTLVKELVSNPASEEKLIGTSFLLRLLGAAIALILATVIAFFTDYNQDFMSFAVITVLGIGLLFQSVDVIELYLQAHLRSKISVILKNISYVLSSLFKVYLLLNNFPLLYFAIAVVVDLAFAAVLMIIYTNKNLSIKLMHWQWDGEIAKSLLKTGWPLIISAITVILYMRVDQIMIKNILGSAAVGNYSAAIRITEMLFIIPVVISNSVFPTLVKSKDNPTAFVSNLTKLYSTLIYAGLLLSVVIMALSPFIIFLLYGEQYKDAATVLQIHVWSSIFVFIGVASSQQLVIENQSKVSLYRTLAGLFTNIILNIIFIPTFGIQGAAFATLISYAVSSFFSNFLFKKTTSINLLYLKALFIFNKGNRN